jgi:outer membrane protein assembly factor BamB
MSHHTNDLPSLASRPTAVLRFNKNDGVLVWETKLKGELLSLGDGFVTVLVDGQLVFAHTGGELFCLDGASGRVLWSNKLKGLGYDIASLAVQGASASLPPPLVYRRRAANGGGGVEGGGD